MYKNTYTHIRPVSTGSNVTTRLHQQLKVGEGHDEEDGGVMHARTLQADKRLPHGKQR
jgi:hypothetical protein